MNTPELVNCTCIVSALYAQRDLGFAGTDVVPWVPEAISDLLYVLRCLKSPKIIELTVHEHDPVIFADVATALDDALRESFGAINNEIAALPKLEITKDRAIAILMMALSCPSEAQFYASFFDFSPEEVTESVKNVKRHPTGEFFLLLNVARLSPRR